MSFCPLCETQRTRIWIKISTEHQNNCCVIISLKRLDADDGDECERCGFTLITRVWRAGSDVWMRVMELKHHLLAGREPSLHPTITRSPTVFLRRSQTVEAFYTLRTRPGSVWRRFLLPLGSPLSCRPTLPTVLISDWVFLENLILIFFPPSLLQTNL